MRNIPLNAPNGVIIYNTKSKKNAEALQFLRNQEGKQEPGATGQMHLINWSTAGVSTSMKQRF